MTWRPLLYSGCVVRENEMNFFGSLIYSQSYNCSYFTVTIILSCTPNIAVQTIVPNRNDFCRGFFLTLTKSAVSFSCFLSDRRIKFLSTNSWTISQRLFYNATEDTAALLSELASMEAKKKAAIQAPLTLNKETQQVSKRTWFVDSLLFLSLLTGNGLFCTFTGVPVSVNHSEGQLYHRTKSVFFFKNITRSHF